MMRQNLRKGWIIVLSCACAGYDRACGGAERQIRGKGSFNPLKYIEEYILYAAAPSSTTLK